MQDTWKNFVYNLIEAKKQDVDEDTFHKLVENQFQLLEWASYLGEISHKQNIPIGNNGHIQPDILIKKGNEVQFVIEVKRPVHEFTPRERIQLESYMRQLKLEVGLYIGDHIEVIYDKPKSKNAISVLSIELSLEDNHGDEFVELFSKSSFSKDSVIKFCEDRLVQMRHEADLNKIKEELLSKPDEQIAKSLLMTLAEKYADTFTREEISSMLSTITFSAVNNGSVVKEGYYRKENRVPEKPEKHYHDDTVYSLNGGEFLGKGKFVHAVVSLYVKQHPKTSFSELEKIFKPELQGSFGVIRTLDFIQEKDFHGGRRYYTKTDEVLLDCNNVQFAVSSEWRKNNIDNIETLAKNLGFKVVKQQKKNAKGLSQPAQKGNEALINCHITRNSKADGLFNIKDKSLTVLKGSKINPSNIDSISERDLKKRADLIKKHASSVGGDLIVTDDVFFDSPSGAAVFCAGGAANGWISWKDDNGNKLEIYR